MQMQVTTLTRTIMTPEEQRIAIAEACGWRIEVFNGDQCFVPPPPNDDGGWGLDAVPNYLNDLNAMHEAEKVLDVGSYPLRERYLYGLMDIVKLETPQCMAVCATAAQRAKALLRAVGKWVD